MKNHPTEPKFVTIESTDGLQLPGVLYEPHHATDAAVIYLHGNGSSSVFYSMDRTEGVAEKFSDAGYAYLAFNNRGAQLIHRLRKGKDGKKKVMGGTAYERIRDCIKDIDGAVKFLQARRYKKIYLFGVSTGANKICVYHYYKKNNPLSGYLIVSGGDDAGIYYQMLGRKRYLELLKKARQKIRQGKGEELMPPHLVNNTVYSYQGFYDIANPDGDYNNFPYNEYFKKLKLSTKPLFRHFASIDKPSLIVYGSRDEYAWPDMHRVIEALQAQAKHPEVMEFVLIKGADHGYTGKTGELNRALTSWLKRQL